MRRPLFITVRLLLGVALVVLPARSTSAEPEDLEEAWRISAVQVDAVGRATAALERVHELVGAERFDDAAASLLALRRDHPDALVPAPRALGERTPLYWPVSRVVEALLPEFPEASRERMLDAWRAPTRALAERAREGDALALERLAEAWAIAPEGRLALRALARSDLEAGRYGSAAERLERWLRLSRNMPHAARAAALLELVDARAGMGDERGLDQVSARWPAASIVRVATPAGGTTPARRARQAAARLELAASRPRARRGPALPTDPTVLWTLAHDRSGLLVNPNEVGRPERSMAGAAADGSYVILDDGRCVRRIHARTGRVAWRFPPARPGAWDYGVIQRYARYDVPMRTVTVAGDVVLVVLGDPAGEGSFLYRGREIHVDEESRESRTRLVALDRETGRLLWTTGRATETNPVLADPATGCHSAPLVVGDAVYALFIRRFAASAVHLARLDLTTGRPTWVAFVGTGESGRAAGIEEGANRFAEEDVRCGPWGARPALAEGEICVVPHAGFAAGVDAENGRVRWARALPRFDVSFPRLVTLGFSARNEPVAHAGAWILAPLDCPHLVALERGTGRWLWSRDPEAEDDVEAWHHFLGVDRTPRGGPWLKLCDWDPALLKTAAPDGPLVSTGYVAGYGPPGRPLDIGDRLVVAGSEERVPGDDREMRVVLASAPWLRTGLRRVGDARRATVESPSFPQGGDVLLVNGVWVVVGTECTGALGSYEEARAWIKAQAGDRLADDPAAAAALDARLALDAERAREALEVAVATGDDASIDVVLAAMRVLVDREADGVEVLAASLLDLAPARGAALLSDLLQGRVRGRRVEALVAQLDRWVLRGRTGRVEVADGVTVRADLIAAARLRRLRARPDAAGAIRERDARHEAAVSSVLRGSEGDLRESIRRAAGTPAADMGRRMLGARLEAEGRLDEAAALLADERLTPPAGGDEAGVARRRRLAALQGRQAVLLARSGQVARARSLLADLDRWAPGRPWRLADGRTARVAENELGQEHGWRVGRGPEKHLGLWPDGAAAPDGPALRSLVVPALIGPGAATAGDRVVVLRGLTQEVWDLAAGRRLAAWPGPGRGWFGGTLQEVASWHPDGGVLVTSLVAGEPADLAGLSAGDWILRWDGLPLRRAAELMRRVSGAEEGVPLRVEVLRGGRRVLQRFVPGARPERDGLVLDREALYAAADGRVLVPGRVDLAWIDPARAVRTPLWSWEGAGVLRAVRVVGRRAVVTIRRHREADVVVSVDLEAGKEVWRRDVDGRVLGVEASGSALIVVAADPASVVVLDAWNGSPRARMALIERRELPQGHYALIAAPASAVVHGRVWGVVDAPTGGYGLRVLDTTTGTVSYEPLADEGFQPLIAADGVVAIAIADRVLDVIAPDPGTGLPHWRTRTGGDEADGNARPVVLRALDFNSRLYLSGGRLYVARVIRGRGIDVETVAIDLEALGPEERRREIPSHRVLRPLAGPERLPGLGPYSYLLDASATPEGIVVSAASFGAASQRTILSLARDGRSRAWRASPGRAGGVVEVHRHPPSRVGTRLLIPDDDGVRIVPVEPGG